MARRQRIWWIDLVVAAIALVVGWAVVPAFLGNRLQGNPFSEAGETVAGAIGIAFTVLAVIAVFRSLGTLWLQSRERTRGARDESRDVSDAVSRHPRVPACPRCMAPMVLRRRRQDGSEFFGCSRFPACRETLPAR